MKTFAKPVALFFKAAAFFLLVPALLFAFFAPKCDSGSKSVGIARSLSHERLGYLFEQLKASRREILAREGDRLAAEGISYEGKAIPTEFLDLKPRKVRPCAHTPNIMLEGCFDEFVYLDFFGIGEDSKYGDHSPRIELRYANDGGPQVLWRGTKNEPSEQDADGNPH